MHGKIYYNIRFCLKRESCVCVCYHVFRYYETDFDEICYKDSLCPGITHQLFVITIFHHNAGETSERS